MRSRKDEIARWAQHYDGIKVRKDGSLPTKPVVPCRIQPEAAVSDDCIKWLKGKGCQVDRMNVGKLQSPWGGWAQYGIKGGGDLFVIFHGLHIEIECKAGRGGLWKLSQQARKKEVEQAKGVYIIAHGVEELEHFWDLVVMQRFGAAS